MKRTMTVGLLGAVLAITVGFISTNAISATPFLMAGNEISPNESAYMIGHVEYTVRGADGQIKQYAQGDNMIVDKGKACAGQMIFANIASDVCDITAGTTGFNFIAIGNATGDGVSGDELELDSDTATGEMDRVGSTVSFVSTGPNTVATITSDQFSFEDITSTTVEQSGLFDDDGTSVPGNNMFAMRDNLGIDVTFADTLTVTWKITLGSTTVP